MRARDTAVRRAHMESYCEARRHELIELGAVPADLLGLRAGRLSELVITARLAEHLRRSGIAAVLNHPSRG